MPLTDEELDDFMRRRADADSVRADEMLTRGQEPARRTDPEEAAAQLFEADRRRRILRGESQREAAAGADQLRQQQAIPRTLAQEAARPPPEPRQDVKIVEATKRALALRTTPPTGELGEPAPITAKEQATRMAASGAFQAAKAAGLPADVAQGVAGKVTGGTAPRTFQQELGLPDDDDSTLKSVTRAALGVAGTPSLVSKAAAEAIAAIIPGAEAQLEEVVEPLKPEPQELDLVEGQTMRFMRVLNGVAQLTREALFEVPTGTRGPGDGGAGSLPGFPGMGVPTTVIDPAEREQRTEALIGAMQSGDLLGSLEELAGLAFGERAISVGELLTGVRNENRHGFRTDRQEEGTLRRLYLNTMESIETDRSLLNDFQHWRNALGEDSGLAAGLDAATAFGLELILPWELPAIKAGSTARKGAARAQSFFELMPATGQKGIPELGPSLSNFAQAMSRSEVDWGDYTARHWLRGLQEGQVTIDDLPDVIRLRAEEQALTRYDMTLDELMREAGFGRGAGDDVELLPGIDPNVFSERRQRVRQPSKGSSLSRAELDAVQAKIQAAVKAGVIDDQASFYDFLRGKNYRLEPGEVARWLQKGEPIDFSRPDYVLRDFNGVHKFTGSLPEMVQKMVRRKFDGDLITFGDTRDVVTWGSRGAPKITSPRHTAHVDEDAFVRAYRAAHPEATPKTVRPTGGVALLELDDGTAVNPRRGLEALLDNITGMPGSRSGVPTEGRVADVLRAAGRQWGREKLGSHNLTMLQNGQLVTPQEARHIKGQRTKVLRDAGLPADVIDAKVGQSIALDDVELRSVGTLGDALGFDVAQHLEGGVLTPEGWRKVQRELEQAVGGAAADARIAFRGTKTFARQLLSVIQDVGTDRKKFGASRRWWQKAAAGINRRFFDADLGDLAPNTQGIWRKARSKAETNPDDLMSEIQDELSKRRGLLRPADLGLVLHKFVKDFVPVTPAKADLARRIGDVGPKRSAQIKAWRDEVRALTPRDAPYWLDIEDDGLLLGHLLGWRDEVTHDRTKLAKGLVAAVFPEQDVKGTTVEDLLNDITDVDLLKIYDDVFLKGDFQSERLRAVVQRYTSSKVEIDPTTALFNFVLSKRGEAIINDAMGEMLHRGIVVPKNDSRVKALTEALQGTLFTRGADGQRTSKYPESVVAWADAQLRRWGLTEGSGAQLVDVDGVFVPEFLAADLERWSKATGIDSRTLFKSDAANTAYRVFKKGLTHGFVFAPNPAYFTGQAIGVGLTMLTTRGLANMATGGMAATRHAPLIGHMLRRTSKGVRTWFKPSASARYITTPTGIYTADELVDIARARGLDESGSRVETAQQLGAWIRDHSRGALDPRRLGSALQATLEDFASVFDQTARYATLVDELERGANLEQAVDAARKSALDFGDLTPWEREHARKWITFYAFIRKNGDAYTLAMFEHPERFMKGVRFAKESNKLMFTDQEIYTLDENDRARLTLYAGDEVVKTGGRVDPRYRTMALQSTPMGVIEYLNSFDLLLQPLRLAAGIAAQGAQVPLNAATGADLRFAETMAGDGSLDEAVSALGPQLKIPMMAIYRQNGRGWDLENHQANRIPPWLVESPILGPMAMDLYGVEPVPLRPGIDHPATADVIIAGDGYRWAAGGGAAVDSFAANPEVWAQRFMWQSTKELMGRSLSAVDKELKALGYEPTPRLADGTEVTRGDRSLNGQTPLMESMAYISGLRWTPIESEAEAIEQRRADAERAIRDRFQPVNTLLPQDQRVR